METDINKILDNLSDKDIENLKEMANQIFGNDNSAQSPPKAENPPKSEETAVPSLNIGAVSNMLKTFHRDDPRLDLIKSLKPLLSPKRAERADEAIKMLRLIDMLPALQKSGLLGELMK